MLEKAHRSNDSDEALAQRSTSAEAISAENGSTASPTVPYVVGVGASAGGLEALERLFDGMPADTGLAFVVIQHLSPDFKSLMDELLARHTRIAIHRVEDGMAVEPNAIYLIPPKKEMIISDGHLLLTDKDPAQGLTLPIDTFFRSLAQDIGGRAVGIVLSGTGSDGSRGIRDIHEAGGLVIAQDVETARFDGMPKSAVDTGVVDFVLPPEKIPEVLLRYVRHPAAKDRSALSAAPASETSMEAVFRLLRREYGIDFSHYKPNTVSRRIERRLLLNQSIDLDDYVERLARDSGELNALYRDLLIGVTKFFRDREAFERLQSEVIPGLLAGVPPKGEVRLWVAGCATGEEAYSLAMLIDEQLSAMDRENHVKIFATDVHRASLEFASAGVYSEASLSEVTPDRLTRYFTRKGDGYQVAADLRKMIVFAPHNVIRDAPFTKLDLIACRNLLIYLQPLAQKKVLSLFHFGLKTGGVLFLGPSESPGELTEEFDPIDNQWKIYRKRRDVRLSADLRLPMSSGFVGPRPGGGGAMHPQPAMADPHLLRAYDTLLEEHVPPSLLVSERRELVHSFSGAGKYLQVRDGRPSVDILEMIDDQLRIPLAGALQRAMKEHGPVVYRGVRVAWEDRVQDLKIAVRPVSDRRCDGSHYLITFEEQTPMQPAVDEADEIDLGEASREQLRSLEAELRYTKENLQATIEELETSNEELQATNEELVASNEELQSTNEELHSVNEELYTVNAEYQRKIVELTQLNDDMDNLLASTDVGTMFLDRNLCIRKFTPQLAEAFHLLPQDVGRRVDSFSHSIDFPGLLDAIGGVLETETPFEKQVRDRKGKWYLLRIRPYRSASKVEGIVLTLIDVHVLKQTEKRLQLMSKVFMDAADPIVIEDFSGKIIGLNREAERAYGWSREELLGQSIDVLIPEELRERARALRQRCRNAEHVRNVDTVRCTRSGECVPVMLTLSLLSDEAGEPFAVATMARDISARKQAEQEIARYAARLEASNRELREHIAVRREAEKEAREAVQRRDQFLAMLSHELRNPLGAILNATYVMDRRPPGSNDFERARDVVKRQARQMAHLLADLLDVARVTQGKIEIRREVVDLRDAVRDAVEAMRPVIAEHEQHLSVELPDNPIPVCGDPARLQQIQVNLLSNASKYTPRGGQIAIAVRGEQEGAVIAVRDHGAGISPEMLERIFDPFVQSDETISRSDGGMGVGLTLVRMLVAMHGGTVTAASDGPGKGSLFTVRLPLAETAETPPPEIDGAGHSAGTWRILLVEDNPDSRGMLRTLLELDGHEVRCADDGNEGLEAFRSGRFDVALVDIGLPGIDGYELARRIRASEGGQAIRLVALTGYGRPADHDAVMRAGFDDHLVKPLHPDDLKRVFDQLAPPPSSNRSRARKAEESGPVGPGPNETPDRP